LLNRQTKKKNHHQTDINDTKHRFHEPEQNQGRKFVRCLSPPVREEVARDHFSSSSSDKPKEKKINIQGAV